MTGTTTSLEVRRQGKKLMLYAMGRTPKGTKYIVNRIEMKEDPITHKPIKADIPAEIAEVLGQTPE